MATTETHQAIETVFRIERARLIAGLARMVRDVGLAEELAQDALVTALVRMAERPASRQTRRLADGRGQAPGDRRVPPRPDAGAQARRDRRGTLDEATSDDARRGRSKRRWTTMSATSCWA